MNKGGRELTTQSARTRLSVLPRILHLLLTSICETGHVATSDRNHSLAFKRCSFLFLWPCDQGTSPDLRPGKCRALTTGLPGHPLNALLLIICTLESGLIFHRKENCGLISLPHRIYLPVITEICK